MRFNRFFVLLFLTFGLYGSKASSLSVDELEKQERELAYQWAKLEQLNLNYGRFVDLFDGAYVGNRGLVASLDQFSAQNLQWLSQWEQILSVANLANRLDTSSLIQLSQTLQTLLDGQREQFTRFGLEAAYIRQLADTIVDRANRIEHVNPGNFSQVDYRPFITDFNRQVRDLVSHASSIRALVDWRMNEMEGFYAAVHGRVRGAVREMLLEQGSIPLAAAIQLIDEIFLIDQIAKPIFHDVMREYELIREYDYHFMLAHAEISLRKMESEINRFRSLARSEQLPEFYVEDYLRSMERVYRDAKSHVEFMESSPRAMLLNWANSELQRYFANRIRNGDKTVNQRLLQTLAMLTESHLETLSVDELRQIELLWQEVGTFELNQ